MATFDQLPPDQRAIIELVVRRGRSYDSLADVLEMSPQRVRELARGALAELSPVTAERVDPQWRGQVADYLLGQQSGPESTATRGHLRRSEPARVWALSLLDSLDSLYGNGSPPTIPDGDERPRERERRGRTGAAVAEPPPPPPEKPPAPREEPRERVFAEPPPRPREPRPTRAERRAARADARAAAREERRQRTASLSPEAQRALERRRRLGAVLGGVAVAAAVAVGVLALTGSFSSTKKPKRGAQNGPAARIIGDIALQPVGGSGDQGIAVIGQRGTQRQLLIQAKVKPSTSGFAYEVWLYNSPNDLVSLGAQVTDQQGNYLGSGALPANYGRYKFIDISYEKIGRTTAHNGPSVLRGAFADIQAPPPASAGASSSGTGAAPGASSGAGALPGSSGGATPTPTPAP